MKLKPGRGRNSAPTFKRPTKTFDDEAEIPTLIARCESESPASGSQVDPSKLVKFEDLPISSRTLTALHEAQFTVATQIQAAAVPHALAGRDILGAAKTGSGKTLSFVIPLLEKLYKERWSTEDGLGAIIISPTRELAMQIFEVVRIVGRKHDFSAGLVTGGKKEYEIEQQRIIKMNIIVATPGRLLQHFETTSQFDASNLQCLILDEADRILDLGASINTSIQAYLSPLPFFATPTILSTLLTLTLTPSIFFISSSSRSFVSLAMTGFRDQLDGILRYIPSNDRLTMLYSATQTKKVKDLARLSLNNPEYIAIHETTKEVIPSQLVQNYIVLDLKDKLDTLYSFLKTHLKSKIMVFLSTCSQVRYVFELFRSMQPGIPLTCLHGKIKQEKRTLIYLDYTRKKAACMFATDIASRGLDFPEVDWVIQVDVPEDAAMYIHRVGRTARHQAKGRSLCMVLANEEAPLNNLLAEKGVSVKKLTVNPKINFTVHNKAAALLAQESSYVLLAKKAFTGYLRSLSLLHNYRVDVHTINVDGFAKSLGLPFTPKLPSSILLANDNGMSTNKGDNGDNEDNEGDNNQYINVNAESLREANRSKKNTNRALDKLKKQIKEKKMIKQLLRYIRAEGIDPESAEGQLLLEKLKSELEGTKKSDDDDDDDDDGELHAPKDAKVDKGSAKTTSVSSLISKENTRMTFDSDSDEDAEPEEFFAIKNETEASHTRLFTETGEFPSAADQPIAASTAELSRKIQKKNLEKAKLKITVDGVSKSIALKGEGGKRKIRFDEDGEAVEPEVNALESLVEQMKGKGDKKNGSDSDSDSDSSSSSDSSDGSESDSDGSPESSSSKNTTLSGSRKEKLDAKIENGSRKKTDKRAEAIEEHTRRVRQRVDAGRQEDLLREKERLRARKMKAKEQRKGPKAGSDDEMEVTAMLGSDSDDDNDGDNDDDSDVSQSRIQRHGGEGDGSKSAGLYDMDEDSEAGSDNDSEDAEYLERQALGMIR